MTSEAESKEKHGVWDPYAGVDYNLTLCRLQHIYHGQPYARVDLNPVPEVDFIAQSGTEDLASAWWLMQWLTMTPAFQKDWSVGIRLTYSPTKNVVITKNNKTFFLNEHLGFTLKYC